MPPEARAALIDSLDDTDPEVRVTASIERELAGPLDGTWAVSAAEMFPHQRFVPLLEAQRRTLGDEDTEAFDEVFESAIEVCKQAAE